MSPPADTLLTAEAISERIGVLAERISADYGGRSPILIGVLRGSVMFLADLARRLRIPARFEFMAISSYAGGARSGVVRILKDLDASIAGEDVILVEDIIDTGLTATYLTATLRARAPASLEICALLDKSARRIVEVPIRYRGFEIPDEFVIGYGLDYNGRYRNLRRIVGAGDLSKLRNDPGAFDDHFDDAPSSQTGNASA
ncbi:MAG: hypoxanthine phosphoribosyltransferase [Actinomycetota bacterium]|nr:hypoxanthine phosphoribosyltransferase [Actinomycetota bacterium]